MPESMPESTLFFFEAANIKVMAVEEHDLQLLNERVDALLMHEFNKLVLKDNFTFNFERSKDLVTFLFCSNQLHCSKQSKVTKKAVSKNSYFLHGRR